MILKPTYQGRTRTEMLRIILDSTWIYWRALESAEVTAFFDVLLAFIRKGYDDTNIAVPVEVEKVWKRSRAKIITKYMEPEAQEEPTL